MLTLRKKWIFDIKNVVEFAKKQMEMTTITNL